MSYDTLLVLSGPGVAPYSARGLRQTLEPIAAAAQLRRTVNGTLTDVSSPEFRKYRSTISCRDQMAPALDGVWPGQELSVECVAELSYPTATGSPGRPMAGSSAGEAVRTEGAFTFYRPVLQMRVVGFSTDTDEWDAAVGWTLELEEI
jgi:hypothetical protein